MDVVSEVDGEEVRALLFTSVASDEWSIEVDSEEGG